MITYLFRCCFIFEYKYQFAWRQSFCIALFFVHKTQQEVERVVSDPLTLRKAFIGRDDPEFELIHDAMKGCVKLEVEISKVHKFIRHKYSKYFKELQEFVVEPLKYANAVKLIGFGRDLEPLVEKLTRARYAPATIVKILVCLSTAVIPEEQTLTEQGYGSKARGVAISHTHSHILEACEVVNELHNAKAMLLDYTQIRMDIYSPNVSAIVCARQRLPAPPPPPRPFHTTPAAQVGPAIANQVIGVVGGLDNLVKLPAEHVELLGSTRLKRKEKEAAKSADAGRYHGSFFLNCDIVQAQPPDFRDRALRMVRNRVTRAARVDAARDNPDASIGRKLRDEILRLIAGIMDGSIESSYTKHRHRNKRIRDRDAQDNAVLAAVGHAANQPRHLISQYGEPFAKFPRYN